MIIIKYQILQIIFCVFLLEGIAASWTTLAIAQNVLMILRLIKQSFRTFARPCSKYSKKIAIRFQRMENLMCLIKLVMIVWKNLWVLRTAINAWRITRLVCSRRSKKSTIVRNIIKILWKVLISAVNVIQDSVLMTSKGRVSLLTRKLVLSTLRFISIKMKSSSRAWTIMRIIRSNIQQRILFNSISSWNVTVNLFPC